MKFTRQITLVLSNGSVRETKPRPWNVAGGSPLANLFQDDNVQSLTVTLKKGGTITYARTELG